MNNGIGELELVGDASLLVPGERLNSNMAPSIMRDDRGATLAVGSPGADRITSALATVIGAVALNGRSLQDAIQQPRFHVAVEESGEAVVKSEPGARFPDYHLSIDQFDGLHMYFGGVGAAMIDSNGRLSAEVDPRRPGVAGVWSDREN
jgi:gamma-glutamyltranspeptidase/glutathione hydrolase